MGGKKRLGRWYFQVLIHRDKMCSLILNEKNELMVKSNVRPARKQEIPNRAVEITERIKGSSKCTSF